MDKPSEPTHGPAKPIHAPHRRRWRRSPTVGVWPPVFTRQDMGRTLKGGPAHKIKACTALVNVHHKILYSTKYATFLVTLPLQNI